MRVLIACEFPTLNGGEYSMLATLPTLESAGIEPVFACPPEGPLPDHLNETGRTFFPFECYDESGKRKSQAEIRSRLAEIIRQAAPQLVHANSLSMGRLLGPVIEAEQVPGITHIRDIYKLSKQAMRDVNQNHRILCVSAATRNFHLQYGLSASRSEVLYNGVDLEKFFPQPSNGELQQELNLPAGSKFIACIGQFSLRKGQDLVAEAFAHIAANFPEWHLLYLGERYSQKSETKAYVNKIEQILSSWEKQNRVHYLGYRFEMAKVYPEIDVLIHGARQEPLGRVLLESAACGLPILATDVGGTREILAADDGEDPAGLIVPPQNVSALTQGLTQLLNDNTLRAKLSQYARERAEKRFDRRLSATKLLHIYQTFQQQ
ncbi:Glycosyltransferase [Planctomycetales bacterium 10988]|nr:Glycosyltransferase [Planctomycetales bacterium 10988]